MTPGRALLAVTGLVAFSVATGVAVARLLPSDYPAQQIEAAAPAAQVADTPAAPLPELRTATFGAIAPFAPLATPFRQSVVREASLSPQASSETLNVETPPGAFIAYAPLPPQRPAELSALLYGASAPLPPSRPRDLGDASTLPPVVVASIAPQAPVATAAAEPQQQPETKPSLVEPAPQATEADVPFRKGQQVFVRIFKQEGELELWLRKGARYTLYKTYPICKWSGRLGPKLREGDYQSPEGFYSVSARQLNPNSHYHLAFNVGFPNALEKQLGYTGGLVMVHGDCKSVGCFAMTNSGIDEIYGFVAAAIGAGQKEVPVNIFPFRLTDTKLARETNTRLLSFAPAEHAKWAPFWQNLKEGYDLFEQTGEPPTAYACGGRYAFNSAGASCKRIAGWGI